MDFQNNCENNNECKNIVYKKNVDEVISSDTTPYIKTLLQTIVKYDMTNYELFSKISDIIIYLNIPESQIFRKRVASEYYLPDILPILSKQDKFPEIFEDISVPDDYKTIISTFIDNKIKEMTIYMGNTLYYFENPTERMYSNIYNYNTLFKIKTNPRLNICKNKNKIDSTEKPENIIYYLEDGNMYCFTIDNLYQQFEEQNFINENTGKLFDMRFVEYFKNRYNIILKSRGFLEFGDKYGFSIEEKIKKIKKKKSKIKIDIDLEKIIEEDIKNLENLLIEDYETNLIENEIKKDEMIGDKDLDNKVISKKEDIIGNGSEKDNSIKNESEKDDSGSEKDDSGSDNEDSGSEKDDNGSDNEDSGSEKDDNGSDNEDSGSEKDDNGSDNEDSGSEKDDNGSDNEDSGSEKDDNGSDNEDSGSEKDDNGSDNEDSGSEKDDNGSDNEDSGSEKDDNGSDNEDSGSEKDDSGSDNEDSGSDNEDSGSEKDDSGSDNEGKEVNKNEDKKIKELCKYCSKNITKKLKTIIFNKDKSSKIVNFCSFKCFENHDEFVHK